MSYNIVRFEPEGAERGIFPTLFVFARIDEFERISLLTNDSAGNIVPESKRQVRVVSGASAKVLIFVLSILPIVATLVVPVLRSRRYKPRKT